VRRPAELAAQLVLLMRRKSLARQTMNVDEEIVGALKGYEVLVR
jgi:hypothetical protein